MADEPDDDVVPGTAPSDTDLLTFALSGKTLFKDLGISAFAKRFGAPDRQATGHWCSFCRGIWFGYPLEVACPVCGNRHG